MTKTRIAYKAVMVGLILGLLMMAAPSLAQAQAPIKVQGLWLSSYKGKVKPLQVFVFQRGGKIKWYGGKNRGSGYIKGGTIFGLWMIRGRKLNASGEFTQIGINNRALKIRWSNGQIWFRPPEKSQASSRKTKLGTPSPRAEILFPDLDGYWDDDKGRHFFVIHDGGSGIVFTEYYKEVFPGIGGIGSVYGDNVVVDWDANGQWSKRRGKVTKKTLHNRGIRIKWEHGDTWWRR